MTNRDRINKMTNEELADILCGCNFCSNQNHLGQCGLGGEAIKEDCKRGKTEWLSQEAELTADEMFEELKYKKIVEQGGAVYYTREEKGIAILGSNYLVTGNGVITGVEDKAIHKKIEELKKDNEKEIS